MTDVVELDPSNPQATVCLHCGRGWDDSVSTSRTPTPSGRCPFEYEHEYAPTAVKLPTLWDLLPQLIARREQLEHLRHAGPVPAGILNHDEYDDAQDALFHELAVLEAMCQTGEEGGFDA